MKNTIRLAAVILAAAALAAPAAAQTMPEPTASPAPVQTMQPMPSSAPAATGAPAATTEPAAKPSIKKLKTGKLSFSEMRYGLTHPGVEISMLRHMKKVDFNNIRIVRVSPVFRRTLRIGAQFDDPATVALDNVFALQDAMLAQTNGSNSPIANLQNVLANINVSNALNNVLNNTTVNAVVTLSDVLNGNKIGIGQVLGVYVHGFSIINTIIK